MSTYAFILGRKHLLSIAELCNVLGEKAEIIDVKPEALIVTPPTDITNPQVALNRLGGTVKIGTVLLEMPLNTPIETLSSAVSQLLIDRFKDRTSKFLYGISAYNIAQKHEIFLKKMLNLIKKDLKANELKSRFINNNFKNPENAAIKGEKLIEEGAEILIIRGEHRYFVAITNALQDFEGYGKRDFDRPARDAKLGMLPPKLAQIMINLSGLTNINETPDNTPGYIRQTVYDPFVGIGTILMEAFLLGYDVIGSDIESKIIEKCKKNLDWIRNDFYLPGQKERLFVKDAAMLTRQDLPEQVDIVATESYLGPPQAIFPSPEEMRRTFNGISETLYRFFKAMSGILKPGTPIIICMPVYRRSDRFFFIEALPERISALGYDIQPLIPNQLAAKFGIRLHDRQSLIYDRPEQIVGREIWKFVKK